MQVRIKRRAEQPATDLPDDIHPIIKRVLAGRKINTLSEFQYNLDGLLSFESLANIEAAVTLLEQAIQQQKKILIVADFDTDGATSCALAMRGLKLLGARDVHYLVPNRFEYGYGLSPEIVEIACQQKPDIIITVDNGIASIEGVRAAREKHIDVLITDHHLPGSELPAANVIVNPNQPDDRFPSKNLAGVGVMFYILIALRSHLRAINWFAENGQPEPNLGVLLDLVALGTVADVVPLDRNNRILVAQGLARIRNGKCCPGIRELLRIANRSIKNISAQDLSFTVAPRLNAAGRLTDMSLGIECLLADDIQLAKTYADQLDQLNQERRTIQTEMTEQALTELDSLVSTSEDKLPNGLCLFKEDWHQGIVGIIASRIKDNVHRPVIAFARDRDNYIKGSARSVKGIHIRDVLDTVANRNPGLIEKFGGHAMAAGLSLREDLLPEFRELFDATVTQFMPEENWGQVLISDGELGSDDFNISLAQTIANFGPWGQGFPEPVFDGKFRLVESKIVAEKHLKLQLQLHNQAKTVEAIAFNTTGSHWPDSVEMVNTLYRLDINEFAGRRRLQLVIDFIEPVSA